MPQDFIDKSALVQVIDWCQQAPSHYLSQSWPSSLWPYRITRLQWVNNLIWNICKFCLVESDLFFTTKIQIIINLDNHFAPNSQQTITKTINKTPTWPSDILSFNEFMGSFSPPGLCKHLAGNIQSHYILEILNNGSFAYGNEQTVWIAFVIKLIWMLMIPNQVPH